MTNNEIEIIDNSKAEINLNKQKDVENLFLQCQILFGYTEEELKGRTKTQDITIVRHLIVYFLRTKYKLTLKEIGKIFGRDHSSIIYAVNNTGAKLFIKDTDATEYFKLLIEKIK